MMKRIIQQLMSELSTLTAPFNPVDIKKTFGKYPSLDITQVPPELIKHAEQLLTLIDLTDLTEQSFDLANQRHSLNEDQDRLIHLAEENSLTQQNIHNLQKRMQENIELVSTSFQQLLPQINENLLKQNKLVPPYSATVDSKTQRLAVEEYNSQLSQSLKEMDARTATLTFFQLTESRNSLVEELKTLGVNLSAKGGKDSIQKLIPSITLSVSQLRDIKSKAIELNQLFAKQISIIDVQAKIKELELQTAKIEEQLESTSLEILINTLPLTVKEGLSKEFQKSVNRLELIQAYQHKLPGALSYIDPFAWKSWIQDQHKYGVGQLEAQNSVNYLQLLEKEYNLKFDRTRLSEQKKALGLLTPMAQSSSESTLEIRKLVEQAQILFKEWALLTTPITLPSSPSAADFYLALLSYASVIEPKLEHMIVVLEKLQKLDSLDIEIFQLRTRYQLDENNDSQPANRKDREELMQLIENQKPAKEVLMWQLKLCESFLDNAVTLEEIKKQLQGAIIHKKDIEAALSISNLGVPISDQLRTISGQLSVLRLAIASSIEEINSLPLLSEQQEELPIPSLEMVHQKTSSLATPPVPQSVNLDRPFIPSQDRFTEPLLSSTQTVSISKQPLLSEKVDPMQSISTVSVGLKHDHIILHSDEQITSPTLTDVDLKPEQLSLNILPHTIRILAEQIFSAHLPTEEQSGEQANTVVLSLKPERPSSILNAQDEQLISPVSGDLNVEPSSVHAQEKIEEPLPIPDKMIRASIESPLTEAVSNEPLTPSDRVVTSSDGPLLAEKAPVEQLTADEIITISRQTLITEGIQLKQPAPTAPMDLESDQLSIKQLTSTDKINLGLKQHLFSEKAHSEPSISISPVLKSPQTAPFIKNSSEEQLISSSPPQTQRKRASPLEPVEDMTTTLAISSPIISNESQKRQNWYQQSIISLKYHPSDIQQWCIDVFNAVEKYSNEDDSYKASHLIRDILFELQFKKDSDVIRSYMRLCPAPENDLNKLLALKPALPLIDEPFNEVTVLPDIPTALQPLYAQYLKLKKEHPIEGELLMQAIHSLRMTKILIDTPHSNLSVTQVPSLFMDPRYEPLKRHRGFFKVWEAIEDFCRMLIGKIMGQAEFEYTKRPCFFRTKSAQLIEEADLIMQRDLLPICAT